MKKPRRQAKPVEPVPTLHEPVDYPDGWDEAYVVKHFLGLSRERVQRMFAESGIAFTNPYSEDFMHMAERGFSYYLPAFIGALKTCLARADEEGREWLWNVDTESILGTIRIRAELQPGTVRKNREEIEDFLRFYESEAPEKHSVSVTMSKIRAVWEEA